MVEKCFSKEIYDDLPDLLKGLVHEFDNREKDIVLLSSLGVLSNCMPNVVGFYDRKKYHPHLYTMVIGPPASGKGSMNYASLLIEKVHQKKLKESRDKINLWEKSKKGDRPDLDARVIPGNVSSSKFYSHMKNNEHGLLIFESEADSISNMLKQDWGNFSDVLRKAFHHEKISISREMDDRFIEITAPKLAMVVSGTEGQVKPLILSQENGLFSRFLYYYFNDGVVWKDVSPKEDYLDYSLAFEDASNKILTLYEQLEKLKTPIEFRLTPEQWEKLNSTLETATSIFEKSGLGSLTDFKNALEKLEELNAQLKETKIKMDLTEYKTLIQSHQEQMISNIKAMERFENHFDATIKQAKIYPNWAVVVFMVSLVLGVGAVVLVVISYLN